MPAEGTTLEVESLPLLVDPGLARSGGMSIPVRHTCLPDGPLTAFGAALAQPFHPTGADGPGAHRPCAFADAFPGPVADTELLGRLAA